MYDKKKVSISIGGGLGDAIMIYLANPESSCSDGEDNFPTTNHRASVWLRRLRHFKEVNPDISVMLLLTSHNKATKELFETNPYIDTIQEERWAPPMFDHYRLWDWTISEYDQTKMSVVRIEMEYNPIHWFYDYNEYESDEFDLFLTDDDKAKSAVLTETYITCHPEAPAPRDIMPLYKYVELEEEINHQGITMVRLGAGKHNVRVSVNLVLNSSGFVGTHSSMCLPAWYAGWKYGIRTACLIPQIEHFTRIKEQKSAVAWGFDKPFNRTYEFFNQADASTQNMKDISDWILE